MLYDYPITVPAGTSARSPVETTLKLTAGLIVNLSVEFPAGCRGYVYTVIRRGGHQLYPSNPSGALNAEDFTVQAWDLFPLMEAPYEVKAYSWSPDADFQHTLTVRIDLVRIDELLDMLPFIKGLEKLLEFVGVPAEEITPGPAAPPPAPPAPTEPVCTVGRQKCIGADLYECQEVDGVADWVLIEKDSRECQIVEEEEPEPEPPPPPEPPPEPPAIPPEGKILEISWVMDDVEHPLTDPMPRLRDYRQRFKVRNTGEVEARFRAAYYLTGYGEGFRYSYPVLMVPDQVAYIDWPFWSGARPGEYKVTWHLYADDKDVYQVEATHIIAEEESE